VRRSRSLAFRIIAFSGVWVVIALVITALLLVYSYRNHSARHFDEHVSIHLEELLEAGALSANGEFWLSANPSDPRYLDLHSGWYWEVIHSGESIRRSASLGDDYLDIGDIQASGDVVIYEIAGPVNEPLRVQVIEFALDDEQEPVLYLSTAPMEGLSDDIADYSVHVIGSFVLLGIGLLLAVVLQVRIATKPLRKISSGIALVRAGKVSKLPQSELKDVDILIDELNNLLDHNAILLKRARNQLADLAHSVKNPLSVINNEARNMGDEQGSLIIKQTGDISRNVDHYLSRARTFGTEKILGARSAVIPVVEDLVFVLQHIRQEQALEFDCSGLKECWFRGEGQDLEEMLGNLLDNASKWAKCTVLIRAESADGRLSIKVEDDGPGIPKAEIENVMRRGHKLDESKPGHGQGLGIIRDIVDLYGGQLSLGESALGGLKVTVDLPAV
jgi:signal transduction histidine kinase